MSILVLVAQEVVTGAGSFNNTTQVYACALSPLGVVGPAGICWLKQENGDTQYG